MAYTVLQFVKCNWLALIRHRVVPTDYFSFLTRPNTLITCTVITLNKFSYEYNSNNNTVADPRGGGGGQQVHAPPKIGSTIFFIRMLKNKAQIARESIKTTLELPGPLSGPWTPAESEFGSALVMCVLAHNLLRPPPQ